MTDTTQNIFQKGSHHLFGSKMPGDHGESADPITYDAGEDEALAELEAKRKQQGDLRGRLASNTTQGQSASLLTQPVASA